MCYTLGNIPQMPSAPRLVRAGVTWVTLQWNKPEGCSPEEVVTYTLEIQEDENVSFADSTHVRVFCVSRYYRNGQNTMKTTVAPNLYSHRQRQLVLPTSSPPQGATLLSSCLGKPGNRETRHRAVSQYLRLLPFPKPPSPHPWIIGVLSLSIFPPLSLTNHSLFSTGSLGNVT